MQLHRAGQLADATRLYRQILAQDSRQADAWHLLGVIAHQLGRHDDCEQLIGQAIGLDAGVASYHSNLGLALSAQGRSREALAAYDTALRLDPAYAEAHSNRGAVLRALGDPAAALAAFDAALRTSPDYADAFGNRAIALNDLGRLDEALAANEAALGIRPNHAPTLSSRGTTLYRLGRLDEALDAYDAALRLKLEAPTLANRGAVLLSLGRLDEAMASCQAALCLAPDDTGALYNRAAALHELGRLDAALAAYDTALRVSPDHAETHSNRGAALYELDRLDEALLAYGEAVRIKPDYAEAGSLLIHCLQSVCWWEGLAGRHQALLRQVSTGNGKLALFPLLSFDSTSEQQLAGARSQAKCLAGPVLAKQPPHRDGKIRLGYLSTDFRQHPTAHLISELIERHDRRRFDVIGYSSGVDDGSPERRRLMNGFDRFVDIRTASHADAATLIHRDGIDILVDLNGYTRGARTRILARRPAALQVNFLGYPGTMGADFIDYIIADPIVVPPGDERFFSEAVIRLPNSYQPNDQKRPIAEDTQSRDACGLPAHAFVFCCFNNGFKITPILFALWMRLLAQIPGSVLWLLETNQAAKANLRREAATAGIAPDRLVFAPRQALPEHLARHRLADLFLDTLPYNAHTTASDALWAGLPILTCRGGTFAGRVAASLLTAVGLPDLITSSPDEYEALALALARAPERLSGLKRRLAANRDTAPLFDSRRYTSSLEAAYERMWERHCVGEAPDAITLG